MPRNPAVALVYYALGLAIASAGAISIAFALLVHYDVEIARDWFIAISGYAAPLGFDTRPRELFERLTAAGGLFLYGGGGAIVLMVGMQMLRLGRIASHPWDLSDDRRFALVVDDPQLRVGTTFEGRLRVLKRHKPGQVYRLQLSCARRRVREDGKDVTDTGFFASLDVKVEERGDGAFVPFSFAIPAAAPFSSGWNPLAPDEYHWSLTVDRADAWISLGSVFRLYFGPPRQDEPRPEKAASADLLPLPSMLAADAGVPVSGASSDPWK